MLTPVIPEYRHRRIKPKKVQPGPPVHPGIPIVRAYSPGWPSPLLEVVFTQPVVWDHANVPSEFRVLTSGGATIWCIGVTRVYTEAGTEIELNGMVSPGDRWELNAPMDGITPVVAYPQSGIVE